MSLIIIGLIFIFLGAGYLYVFIIEYRQDNNLLKTGIKTTGTVIDTSSFPSEDDLQSSQYKLLIEFKDNNNHTHHIKTKGFESEIHILQKDMIGKKVSVIYNPEDPNSGRIAPDIKYKFPIFKSAVCILSLVIGILFIISYFKTQ